MFPFVKHPDSFLKAEKPRLLMLAAVMIAMFSVPVFLTDFLTDMVVYSVVAQKLLAGGLLYAEAVDSKPPLIYYTYAAIFFLFGKQNLIAVKLLTMVVNFLSCVLVYLIAEQLFNRRTAVLSALLFLLALFSGLGDDFLSSNTETYMNLFLLAAICFFVRGGFALRNSHLFLAGLFTGIGFLYRLQGGVLMAVFPVIILMTFRVSWRTIGKLFLLGGGFLLPSLVAVIYFYNKGCLYDLYFWMVHFNFFYIRKGVAGVPLASVVAAIAPVLAGQAQFLFLGGRQAASSLRSALSDRKGMFLALFLAGSLVTYLMGMRFYGHYFLQVLPPLALLAAVGLDGLREKQQGGRAMRFYARNILVFLLLPPAVFWVINLARFHGGAAREPMDNLKAFIHRHTDPGDRIYLWGGSKRLIFYSDRVFATRFIHNNYQTGRMWGTPHNWDSATPKMNRAMEMPESWEMLMKDLRDCRPKIIIDKARARWHFTVDAYPELDAFVRNSYHPCGELDGHSVYLRR